MVSEGRARGGVLQIQAASRVATGSGRGRGRWCSSARDNLAARERFAFDELVAHPGEGRRFEQSVTVGLAEGRRAVASASDALARWLRDVALADVVDAGLGEAALWVVRRTRLSVTRFRASSETATVSTFCSGVGRMWAQRRTTVASSGGGLVEAVALRVHLDPASCGRSRSRRASSRSTARRPRGARSRRGCAIRGRPRTPDRGRGTSAVPSSMSPTTSTTPPTGRCWRTSCWQAPSLSDRRRAGVPLAGPAR